jgi:hypothetical protein
MIIKFSNSQTISFELANNPVAEIYKKIYKHLQHIDIPFRPWDNPFYVHNTQTLIDAGRAVNVTVDQTQLSSQLYLNQLHQIYETSYNGDPAWLDFHEQIHLIEDGRTNFKKLSIDYRELAGPLSCAFDQNWTKYQVTKVEPGDVFVRWAELGKQPPNYWTNREPDNFDRLCELAKPWLKLRPKIEIALETRDFLQKSNSIEFLDWWKQYQEPWCQHWGIDSWSIENMAGAIPLGKIKVDLIDRLTQLLTQHHPVRVMI